MSPAELRVLLKCNATRLCIMYLQYFTPPKLATCVQARFGDTVSDAGLDAWRTAAAAAAVRRRRGAAARRRRDRQRRRRRGAAAS